MRLISFTKCKETNKIRPFTLNINKKTA